MASKVSVIVPAFGNQHALDLSLATIERQTVRPLETIVVDDASNPPIHVPDWCIYARLERIPVHRGSSAAKNHGAWMANGDYLSFCDSDILHLPDALESLLRCIHQWEAEGYPKVLLNTMRVSLPGGYKDKYITDLDRLTDKCRSANLLNDEDAETPALCYEQNESLIGADFFRSMGGYDEIGFPSWGFNNQDLDLRVILSGGQLSSAIPRVSTGKRLYCFHQFHENHCDRQRAQEEFRAKWGAIWTDGLYRRMREMVDSGAAELPLEEARCQ